MRVLEVGPWNSPAEGYLADPDVEAYVAAELGVWEGNGEGNRSAEVFQEALRRIEVACGGLCPSISFYEAPVSAIPDVDFDTIVAANVFGDPLAVPKNPEGTLRAPKDQTDITVRSLARKTAGGGKLEVVESYTPVPHEILFELLGNHGFKLISVKADFDDFAASLEKLYPFSYLTKLHNLDPINRRMAARDHGLLNGVTDPYIATFRLV